MADRFPIFFPRTRATLAQIDQHGRRGVSLAGQALEKRPVKERLELATRAFDNLDHAVGDSRALPLISKRYGDYYRTWQLAGNIVKGVVASGVIPGARQMVGAQEALEGRNHFADGVKLYSDEGDNKIARYKVADLLRHSATDAFEASAMMRDVNKGRELLNGIRSTYEDVSRRRPLDSSTVKSVLRGFEELQSSLTLAAAKAQEAVRPTAAPAPRA